MFENLRLRLAGGDALPQLALLGICVGLLSGAVIIAFRLLVETVQSGFLPDADPENYEALGLLLRFLLPALGGLLVGLLFYSVGKNAVQVGVVHVLERLAYHQGHLPFKNFIMQFLGAAICIISGQSVGREGPVVHLGAASGSMLSQWFHFPNNCTRLLVACGVAAAIAASFNTPIAGVIFTLEVMAIEYTIAGFVPVMLAAVSATLITRLVFGDLPAHIIPPLQMTSFQELPVLLVLGVLVGLLASLFISIVRISVEKTRNMLIWQRTTMAGIVVGTIAVFVPEVMGIGYDTVNAALLGELTVSVLFMILVAKLLATTIGVGLGLPGGLIGPTLYIGAMLGGCIGGAAHWLLGEAIASMGFYVMLGMGAMMGATLRAPLAALMALLELTMNAHAILPGMIVITVAVLSCRHRYGNASIFIMLLKLRGLDYENNPVAQSLRRIGVASIMSRSLVKSEKMLQPAKVASLLNKEPAWIVVQDEKQIPESIMPSADLMQYASMNRGVDVDLSDIPAKRTDVVTVGIRSTLQHALDTMNKYQVDVLLVVQTEGQAGSGVFGVITRQAIQTHYQYRPV